jgi:hypothetical protein
MQIVKTIQHSEECMLQKTYCYYCMYVEIDWRCAVGTE